MTLSSPRNERETCEDEGGEASTQSPSDENMLSAGKGKKDTGMAAAE